MLKIKNYNLFIASVGGYRSLENANVRVIKKSCELRDASCELDLVFGLPSPKKS